MDQCSFQRDFGRVMNDLSDEELGQTHREKELKMLLKKIKEI